jgi:hypothetical protein
MACGVNASTRHNCDNAPVTDRSVRVKEYYAKEVRLCYKTDQFGRQILIGKHFRADNEQGWIYRVGRPGYDTLRDGSPFSIANGYFVDGVHHGDIVRRW